MRGFSVKEYVIEKSISAYLSIDFAKRKAESTAHTHGRGILFSLGLSLLLTGLTSYSHSQYDPEPTEAADPEGVCCVEAYPQQLITLPSEPAFTYAPESTVTIAPEAGIITAGPETALTLNAEAGIPLNAENATPQDAENATPQEAEALDPNYDDSLNRFATGNLFKFIEGAFGALVMVSAGIGAIVAAAFGAYKAAISLLFVAVGAFILRALVSLFFGTNYPSYGGVEFVGGDGV